MPRKSKKIKEKEKTPSRPPIVTIMGHVDHGKTSLLDAIRKTNIVEREFGGITQCIGAYQVSVKTKEGAKKITFIDTPGHEAFNKMRSRGADITDIIVLVIDSKDGVMPQTIESIAHIKEANVPFLVALTKSDLPTSNPEKVKRQLSKECKIEVEGYGGDIVCIPVSSKTKKGIDDLLEMILLLAEMKEIKADPKGKLDAVIIESNLDKHRGPIASVIVKNGTLKIGDEISVENIKGKVRNLINDQGEMLKEALPGTPVEILGLEKIPPVGAKIERLNEEKEIKKETTKEEDIKPEISIEDENNHKLNIILKTDTTGSMEAIELSLSDDIKIINKGVGEITESDILFAKTSKAIIIGFNVKVNNSTQKLAESEKALVKTYQVIYLLLEELKDASEFLNKPEITEKILGKAKIIAQFPGKKYNIAGCKVVEGRIAKGDTIKLIHDEKEIVKSKISSMKHGKEDITKAEIGEECGAVIEPPIDFIIGDMLVSYRKIF